MTVGEHGWRGRASAAVVAVVLLVPVARVASAQGSGQVELFGGGRDGVGSAPFVGLGLAGYGGPFGLRVSGSLGAGDGFGGRGNDHDGSGAICTATFRCVDTNGRDTFSHHRGGGVGWSADADLLFAPFRAYTPRDRGRYGARDGRRGRSPLFGFSPYALLGVGGVGGGSTGNAATLSVGGGVQHGVFDRIVLDVEGRWRAAFANGGRDGSSREWRDSRDAAFGDGFGRRGDGRDGWELRAGIAVAFGARRARAPRDGGWRGDPPPARRWGPPADDGAASRGTPRAASRMVDRALAEADRLVGTRYRDGGDRPSAGFDDAGFVAYVLDRAGVSVPHDRRGLAQSGDAVSTRGSALRTSALQPGDVLLFDDDARGGRGEVAHVALYVGRGRIVHASGSDGVVRYDALSDGARGRWLVDRLVGARRVIR